MKARQTRYTLKIVKMICDKVAEGKTLLDVQKENAELLPKYRTLWVWYRKYPEFKERLDSAYESHMMRIVDEYQYISSLPTPKSLSKEDKLIYEKDRKAKMTGLQFMIKEVGQLLNKRFEKKTTLNHKGDVSAPTIVVTSYSKDGQAGEEEKKGFDQDSMH